MSDNPLAGVPDPAPLAAEAADSPAAGATPRPRASWSGLLRLSLVAVPVKAYPASAAARDGHFHQLHAGCGRRVRHLKHCPAHGPLEAGAVVPGYPVGPDRYVEVDEAELDRLRPARDRALTLETCLEAGRIDPALFAGRSLHLLPDGPAAQHPYAVLVDALRRRRQWALGRVALSGRRQLALVRPAGRLLTLHLLHYPEQLRPAAPLEAELRDAPASEAERLLAGQLLELASGPVDWSAYRDDTAEQLRGLVEALLRGQAPATPAATEEAPVQSLLEALRQSVAQARRLPPETVPAAPARPPARKRARRSP